MEIHYQLTPNDFYSLRRYWWFHKSKLKPWMLVLIILAFSILPSIPIIIQQPLQFVVWIGLPVCLMTLIFLVLFKPLMKWLTRFIPGFLNPRHLVLNEDHLIEQTTVAEVKVKWSQIATLEEDDGYTFYFFINNSQAFIIPKRAFSSPAEAQGFFNQAHRYWEAAKTGQPVLADDSGIWPPPPQSVK